MTNEDTKVVDETKEVKEEAVIDTKQNDTKEKEAEKKEESAAPAVTEPAPPKITAHKVNFEKDVIYLYQFSRTPVIPSISPYCLKVETWLRLAGLKYEVRHLTILSSFLTQTQGSRFKPNSKLFDMLKKTAWTISVEFEYSSWGRYHNLSINKIRIILLLILQMLGIE
ncbi:hypothetical protein WDU94_000922 [Cyamophila willieti]